MNSLHRALYEGPFFKEEADRIFYRSLLAVGAWIALIGILAARGWFSDFSAMPPRMFIVLFLPLVTSLLVTFSRTGGRILQQIPPQHLLYLQSFRTGVEILLWLLFLQNLVPRQMTFEGRNFDILVGLSAPAVAYFVLAMRRMRTVAIVWNILGLALLANIVVVAILSMPVPFRYFLNEPANTIVARFPFVLLPGVLVPVAYSLHFFSLRQLLTQRREVEKRATAGSGPQVTRIPEFTGVVEEKSARRSDGMAE